MHELITIIVPIYNVENYLPRCIESILSQTYTNLEIILVDDGSPDRCGEICDTYARKDDRIRVIHKENGGLSDARNVGLDAATGDYIAFLDSDDYVACNMYEKLYNNIQKNAADISLCSFLYIDENDVPIDELNAFNPIEDGVLSGMSVINDKMTYKNYWYWVVAWNKLYKHSLFDSIRFPVKKQHEDEFIAHGLFHAANKVVCSSEMLYYYVQHQGSVMSKSYSYKRLDAAEAFLDRIEFALNNELDARVTAKFFNQYFCNIYKSYHVAERHDKKVKERRLELKKIYDDKYLRLLKTDCGKINKLIYTIMRMSPYFLCKSAAVIKKMEPFAALIIRQIYRICKVVEYIFRQYYSEYLLLDTPEHGNLGDHAIAIAEEELLCDLNKDFIELTANNMNHYERIFAKFTGRKKTVIITGGGFLGHLWTNEEDRVRRILKSFKKNKVIIFPQTITFDMETDNGRAYFEESKKIYSAHRNLTLYVREGKSFEFVKKYMPDVNVKLVPDIVTSLVPNMKVKERTNILLCFRKDKERIHSEEDQSGIYKTIERKYPLIDIKTTDTVISKNVSTKNRRKEVYNKLEEFSRAKLLITDRLHGMIFAVITNTPCIALGNSSGKVKGVYKWLEDNEYIKYVDDLDQFSNALDSIDINKQYIYDHDRIDKAFIVLKEDILNT